MPVRRVTAPALLLIAALVFTGCTTVPETGRRQLNFMSPDLEMQLGLAEFDKLKRQMPVSANTAANAMLQRVGKRIAAVAPLEGAQWEFVLFESEEANAFCLPGGKVGVFTGILPITKDEAGLATVIGHEVAHAVARHGGERVSAALGLQMIGVALDAATASSKYHRAFVAGYGLGSQLGVALPHSRMQESEADRLGLIYMARAGYDPEAAVGFWRRFAEFNRRQGGETLWFLRTHPLDETRIRDMQKWMPEARAQFRPAEN